MVERLKEATRKARERRFRLLGGDAGVRDVEAEATEGVWAELEETPVDPEHLKRSRIASYRKSGLAGLHFDAFRTPLLKMMREEGWARVGVTSATQNCGKTLVATNLAFSLARYQGTTTALVDLDLRAPQVASRLGYLDRCDIEPFLSGALSTEAYMKRVGGNMAVGFNTKPVGDAAELLQQSSAAHALSRMMRELAPTVALFDLPPMFGGDDSLACMEHVDCVLLVASAGQTRAHEIEECERLIEGGPALLGVVLNRSQKTNGRAYGPVPYYGEVAAEAS